MNLTIEDITRAMRDDSVKSMLLSEVAAVCEVSYQRAEDELLRCWDAMKEKPTKIDGDYVFHGDVGKNSVLVIMMGLSANIAYMIIKDIRRMEDERIKQRNNKELAFYNSLSDADKVEYLRLKDAIANADPEKHEIHWMRMALFQAQREKEQRNSLEEEFMAATEAMRAKIKVQEANEWMRANIEVEEAKPITAKIKAVKTRIRKPKTKKCPGDLLDSENCIDLAIFGI
ncbi:hypothetical protein QDX12_16405 [Escherichia coli]|uniref:hypothetical protein n=1 Tax=Escherichia coli TaxID=562 RepID=UPI000DA5B34C|nr:hypothetical protein [Escherichia coli]EEZ7590106.1 hypothetical protein [Escherichia coli]EFM9646370.1 hypothetical protein [Escherichia coli]MBS8511601.1 hypothetical protein [Escherichia coli]WHG63677.1 hypothetical protein QDX12_16405 [Escherichia coli]WHG67972.1 hypothetical protein QDW94_16375 [Escherichia coli]